MCSLFMANDDNEYTYLRIKVLCEDLSCSLPLTLVVVKCSCCTSRLCPLFIVHCYTNLLIADRFTVHFTISVKHKTCANDKW